MHRSIYLYTHIQIASYTIRPSTEMKLVLPSILESAGLTEGCTRGRKMRPKRPKSMSLRVSPQSCIFFSRMKFQKSQHALRFYKFIETDRLLICFFFSKLFNSGKRSLTARRSFRFFTIYRRIRTLTFYHAYHCP